MSNKGWTYLTPGIPDALFQRGQIPMTKEEIRVLTLAKLRLQAQSRILDVGAGTGSLTIECAHLASQGWVYAVERAPEGLELIRANASKFGVENITIIAGEAPECLADIPPLDGVIIGGSGGKILEIIKVARGLLKPGARVVLNTILLDSLHTAVASLEEEGFLEVDLLAVNISRGRLLGSGRALEPLNPVFIVWGEKGDC